MISRSRCNTMYEYHRLRRVNRLERKALIKHELFSSTGNTYRCRHRDKRSSLVHWTWVLKKAAIVHQQMMRTECRNAYLDHIEHGDKLREHEHLVSSFKKGFKEPLEDHHLPTRVDELLVHNRLRRLQVERPVKQERVRAHFA